MKHLDVTDEHLAGLFSPVGHAWVKGQYLTQLKSSVDRGQWAKVLAKLGLSHSAASRDMRIAAAFGSALEAKRASGDGSIAGAVRAMQAQRTQGLVPGMVETFVAALLAGEKE